MLQIQIDPSMLTGVIQSPNPGGEVGIQPWNCEISMNIVGCAWFDKDNRDSINKKFSTTDEFMEYFFPWKWENEKPTHIRLEWLNADFNTITYFDLELINNTYDDFKEDILKITNHYQSILTDKVIIGTDSGYLNLSEKDIILEYSVSAREVNGNHENCEISIEDDKSNPSNTEPVEIEMQKDYSGFMSSRITEFSQKTAPLNNALDLVFFAKGISSFEFEQEEDKRPNSFIAYPININNNYPRWKNPKAQKLGNDKYQIQYFHDNNDIILAELYCPITPIPKKGNTDATIQLRDEFSGNFLGHTKVKVYDSEELFQKDIFKEKLIQKTSMLFDLPSLFFEYLNKEIEKIIIINNIVDVKKFYQDINKIFTSLIRDRYSIGNPLNHENTEIILNEITIKQQAEEQKKGEELRGIVNIYNKEAKKLGLYELDLKTVSDQITEYDKSVTVETWRLVLNKGNEIEGKLSKTDTGFTMGDKKSILEWLAYWREIVNNVHPIINTSDTEEIKEQKRIQIEIQNEKKQLFKIQFEQIDYFKGKDLNDSKTIESKKTMDAVLQDYFQYQCPTDKFILSIVLNLKSSKKPHLREFDSAEVIDITTKIKAVYLDEYVALRGTKSALYPDISTVLPTPTTPNPDQIDWSNFQAFVLDYDFNGQKGNTIGVNLNNEVENILLKVCNIPPKVIIKVDTLLPADDLSDEISGHLLLMQRGNELHSKVDGQTEWKYLNWCKINLLKYNSATHKIEKPVQLANDYLLPSFLPEEDDIKTTHLTLSNERLSLAAVVDAEDDKVSDQNQDSYSFAYLFTNNIKPEPENPIPPAYALWYGYNYNFFGAVSLNSSVIPELIRKKQTDNWTLPDPQLVNPNIQGKGYKHLRRVPFSKVFSRVTQENKKDLQKIPSGLNLLANELKEKTDQQVCLLNDSQKTVSVEIGKPHTNFWNWYAWNGDKLVTHKEFKDSVFKKEEVLKSIKEKNNLGEKNIYLHDPALENALVVVVDQIFPYKKENVKYLIIDLEEDKETIKDPKTKKESEIVKSVKNNSFNVTFNEDNGEDENKKVITIKDKTITIPEGWIVNVKIHCLVHSDYFVEGKERFHTWMRNQVESKISIINDVKYKNHILTHPTELIFEAALKPIKVISNTELSNQKLWEDMSPFNTAENQVALNLVKNNFRYSYFSRTIVNHQVWHWNGKLTSSLLKIAKDDEMEFPEGLNPKHGDGTNYAMKWEAWEFSDRPDFSALENTTYLRAIKEGDHFPERQTIFTDNRPVDEKALYYRFSTEVFGRYELLGGDYAGSLKSLIKIKNDNTEFVYNQWKRHIKLSTRTTRLPKPVLRFMIPLTASIDQCAKSNDIESGSFMAVLNDRGLGLEDKYEFGVELLNHKANDKDNYYLNAGRDPILSGKGLESLNIDVIYKDDNFYIESPKKTEEENEGNIFKKNNPIAVFTPEGPAGLTFDFAAATPKLIGSTFILKINDINHFIPPENTKMGPWSMVQIAARRNIHKPFWSGEVDKLAELKSEWTAKEWVQFIPDTNSLIPLNWKKEHANYGFVKFKAVGKDLETDAFVMPRLIFGEDSNEEEKTQRYLVISKKVLNAGGLPVETYTATYRWKEGNTFVYNDSLEVDFNPLSIDEGYMRMIIIRVTNKSETDNQILWKMLFGESTAFNIVQDDAQAALPLISKRLALKII